MVPSKIDSPIWGMTISVGMYVLPPSHGNQRTAATQHYSEVGVEASAWGMVQAQENAESLRNCRSRGFFPLLLDGGWQLFNTAEEGRDLPDFLVGDRSFPGRHAGVTDAVADGVGDVPLGVVRRVENELGDRRIKARAKRVGVSVQTAVAAGAVHGIELHAIDEVGVRSRDGAVIVRSAALHGGVHDFGGQPGFGVAGGMIGVGVDEAEQCKPEAAEGEQDKSSDGTKDEFLHESTLWIGNND